MEEEKIDNSEIVVEPTLERTPSSAGQYIHSRELRPARTMDLYAAKNIYRSQAEIDRAKKRGNFQIEKTMTTDANGNIFFLCYDVE